MSYAQKASDDPDHLMFTNVFVPPADYDYFLAHGTWPDKTIFVLEEFGSQSKGSINQHGHFQTEFMGLDVEVKMHRAFPTDGLISVLTPHSLPAKPSLLPRMTAGPAMTRMPPSNTLSWQFYPALLTIAKEKKTIKDGVRLP